MHFMFFFQPLVQMLAEVNHSERISSLSLKVHDCQKILKTLTFMKTQHRKKYFKARM